MNLRHLLARGGRALLATLALGGLTLPALAQGSTLQTLTEGPDRPNGFYVAPVAKWTRIAGQDGLFMGLRGGWVLGGALTLGLAGYGWMDENFPDTRGGFELGYGGLFLEAIIHGDRLLHATASVTLGAGGYRCERRQGSLWTGRNREHLFTVVEPELNLELNVSRLIRLGGGVSYRWTGHNAHDPLKSADLNGWAGSISLKIGRY